MNLSSAKTSRHRAWQLSRVLVVALCVFFLQAVPALADTVRINQVVQTLTSSGVPNIKLGSPVAQDPNTQGNKAGTQQQNGSRNESQASAQTEKVESIIPTVSVTPQIGVEIVEAGEVEGTICDCGELLVAGAAFPKWPFLFLGAVPLVFINNCDDCDEPPRQETPTPTPTPTPTNTPTPTPTPPEVPEPASLLLFGTGLAAFGAGLRRHYAKSKRAEQMKGQQEE